MKHHVPQDFPVYFAAPLEHGLTPQEVMSSRRLHGNNDIVGRLGKKRWQFLVDSLRDPMVWFLIIVSVAYVALGQRTESLVLLLAIIPIVGMDAYLHRRTNITASALATRLATRATVVRDGKQLSIPTAEVVATDIVKVTADEFVPADGILCEGEGVLLDESSLSGESYPIEKTPFVLPSQQASEPLQVPERSWLYAGTRILTGTATIRVIYTGRNTFYGEIILLLRDDKTEKTPLQAAIHVLVLTLLAFATAICLILAVVRLAQGHGWIDALISSATLAVAALPEEFPIVYTFFLGVGVYRMAKRKALVRRAVAVENIGRTTCICTDKTGTLTEGKLRLSKIVPANGSRNDLMRTAILASSPEILDPVNVAIAEIGPSQASISEFRVLARFPFTEDRKRETVAMQKDEIIYVAVKGAPETVFKCITIDELELDRWTKNVEELAGAGFKVLACADRMLQRDEWSGDEPKEDYRLSGLLAFEDPPRKGVKEAIAWCISDGMRVLMITGDHQKTAEGIAAEIGLGTIGKVHSVNAETCLDLEGEVQSSSVIVVARATPGQKLKIVKALKNSGEVVAVTGDGVNDAPALQVADIGIAMGERGTQSARDVASVVLLDDNFASIVHAIAEGRQLFRNLQLSFQYLLTIHLPLVFTAILIPLAGYPLLYHPIHIVWLEMIIHPTALLVFQELPRGGSIPRSDIKHGHFFNRTQWIGILACGALVAFTIAITYYRSLGPQYDQTQHARAMALLVLVFASGALTAGLSRLKSWTSRVVTLSTFLSAFLFLNTSYFAPIFLVERLHFDDFALAALSGLVIGVIASIMGRPRFRGESRSGGSVLLNWQ